MNDFSKRFELNSGWVIESDELIYRVTSGDPNMTNYRTKAGDFWHLSGNVVSFKVGTRYLLYCNEEKLFMSASGSLHPLPDLPYQIDADNRTILIRSGLIQIH